MPEKDLNNFPKDKQKKILIPGPCGNIEALSSYPENKNPKAIAIICHPDPQAEGTMHNKVVTTCAKAFDKLGYASLRFNYRGVGESEGEYGDVKGEIEDALAVHEWVLQSSPNTAIVWLGFSFGSYIAAFCASKYKCQHLISVAPPVERFPFADLKTIDCPWDVVQGDQDKVVEAQAVIDWHLQHPNKEQRNLKIMPGAEHFFHGRLIDLRELLISFFD